MVDWSAPASEASTKRLLYELAMGILVAGSPAIWLIGKQTISWTLFVLGAVTVVLIYGVSRTALGRWAEKWFTRIGKSGRFAVIFVAIPVIWGMIWWLEPPIIPVMSFLAGSTGVLLVVSAVRLLKRLSSNNGRQHPA